MLHIIAIALNTILHIQDIQITAGKKVLLDLPELDIESGRIYGMIGESGSGKSLTLLAIMGLLPSGIQCSGKMIFTIPSLNTDLLQTGDATLQKLRNRHIGMVFQEPMTALNPQMTCGAQLKEAVLVHQKCSPAELNNLLAEALVSVGLTDTERFLNSYPHQISGGQRQRIMIAMATIHKPELVLADEPTTALDPETGKAVMDVLIQRCKSTGSALLLVSHELELIEQVCDHITVLRNGKCLAQGSRKEIFQSRIHPYVQELVDAVPKGKRSDVQEKEPILLVEGLDKAYRRGKNKLAVLKQVEFSLKKGETLAIIGGSGSGKSTIAKVLTGLEKADNGSVIFKGENIGIKRITGIQMVFQDPFASLNQNMTNLEAVAEVLRVKGASRAEAEKRSKELILSVGLQEDQFSRYPHNLSGGQRQRLCIARALASDPEILILDEAVAALDPLVQKQVLDLLKNIQEKTGIIYIFITHNMDVARNFAHCVYQLLPENNL